MTLDQRRSIILPVIRKIISDRADYLIHALAALERCPAHFVGPERINAAFD